uniref:Reverse transcriptase domain-containing protein n=1 Tax=Tanacetum cinerariifolium TaxID=118510 RepID=A0A6L2NAU7_TANCI|nr:hypothetical protein [Tanacetum cinerariifolium]
MFSMGKRKLRALMVIRLLSLKMLGQPGDTSSFSTYLFFNKRLNDDDASYMILTVTRQEIKNAMFSMGNEKAPGPDGYTVAFFKEAWVLLRMILLRRFVSFSLMELMHNYHLDRGPSRCAFKVDIQKAYDTVDWGFLREVLIGFGFHDRMVKWIMECVTTTSFSIIINGSLHGYFKGKRGLRQGDPLSPYLYCSKLELVNLCFADDLFLFAHGDVDSVKVIKEALEEFKNASSLIPSLPKSTTYFCNVLNHVKLLILHILPFEEGRLPVKYLGVLLVSSRLMFGDCKELIEKVESRVHDWKNKSLSAAGRLQLAQSILGSMHFYWASVFILPTRVLHDIEKIIRGFLWCQGNMKKGRANVAWEVVCLPKDEGGLGLRQLDHFNKALMVTHIWKLLSLKESLWVQWIHSYKLQGRNFWDVSVRGNMSWGWRKILQIRPFIREFIRYKIGDGSSISLWFDNGCDHSPLAAVITPRDVFRVGLELSLKLRDVVQNNVWNWPPYLAMIPRHAFNLWLIMKERLKTQDRERNARLFKSQRRSVLQVIEGVIVFSGSNLFRADLRDQEMVSHFLGFGGFKSIVRVYNLEAAEIIIPEVEEIEDDNLHEKLLNVHLLIANIEALKDNPTSSSEPLTKSSSTSLHSFLEETNTFHNSLLEFENFYFDLGEISSGSTTTHSDISLPDYEAFSFNNDHIKEFSSGSPTTQTDICRSEYDSFIFDLTHEEFVDELAHIISPPDIPGNLKTLAKGFYPPSLKFLSFNWESWLIILDLRGDIAVDGCMGVFCEN